MIMLGLLVFGKMRNWCICYNSYRNEADSLLLEEGDVVYFIHLDYVIYISGSVECREKKSQKGLRCFAVK